MCRFLPSNLRKFDIYSGEIFIYLYLFINLTDKAYSILEFQLNIFNNTHSVIMLYSIQYLALKWYIWV